MVLFGLVGSTGDGHLSYFLSPSGECSVIVGSERYRQVHFSNLKVETARVREMAEWNGVSVEEKKMEEKQ